MLPILVISGREEPAIVREVLSLGVAGYVSKSASKDRFAEAIAKALAGDVDDPESLRKLPVAAIPAEESCILRRLRDLSVFT